MKNKKHKSLAASVPAGSESALRGEIRTYGPGAKYFDLVNELLPSATPMGAYCVGLVSVLAWQDGTDPNESDLRSAVRCSTIKQVSDFLTPEYTTNRRTTHPNPADQPNSTTKES
jgi:hypothetical protein